MNILMTLSTLTSGIKLKNQSLLISLLCLALFFPVVFAAAPDFSNVDDVLDGRRILFPVDDLVVTSRFFTDEATGSAINNSLLTSSNSQLTAQTEYTIVHDGTNFATGIGRMFALPRDVILTMTPNSVNIRNNDPSDPASVNFSVPGFPRGLIMDDFTGDGYEDAAILTADAFDDTSGVIRIVTANNVDDLNAGVFSNNGVGPKFVNFDKDISITSGDFNGDGRRQIAIAQVFQGTQVLLYLYDTVVTRDSNGGITTITFVESAFLDYTASTDTLFGADLVAGDFDGVLNQKTARSDDELVLALHHGSTIDLRSLNIETQSTDPDTFDIIPVTRLTIATEVETTEGVLQQLEGERIAWFAEQDQLAVLYLKDLQPNLSFVTSNSALELTLVNNWNIGDDIAPTSSVLGMVLGNFDQSSDFNEAFSLELAVAVEVPNESSLKRFSGIVYQIFPQFQYELNVLSTFSFLSTALPTTTFQLTLAVGDVQGRSLQLGQPQKVTLTDHVQPSVIMGAPPMHIDFIKVPNTDGPGFTFQQVNMTAFPGTDKTADLGMNTQFMFGSSTSGSNTHTETTSVSYSTSESTSVGLSFGIPDVASIGGSLTSSAVQTHDQLVANKYGTYSGNSFEIDVTSGFGDVLWFNSKSISLWIYPAIGHEACPLDSPNCPSECAVGVADCPKLPLHIVFSGPQITTNNEGVAANDVEWFQTPNEVGNILSYAGSLTQLQQDSVGAARFDLLAGPNTFTTGNSGIVQQVKWVDGSSDGNTTGAVKSYSHASSISASANGFIADIGIGGSAGASFQTNTSTSFSTLSSALETMSATTGVEVNLPSFDDAEIYSYPITGYVYGANSNPDRIQTNLDGCLSTTGAKPPTCPDGIQPVDFATHGPLWIAFTANAEAAPSDTWWQTANAYTLPDVALQHPNRWRKVSQTSGPLSAEYCFNEFVPSEPTNTQAYDMKGLFITPEATFNGPQLTTANAGDVLRLTARIHNYSLVDMDNPNLAQPATAVKVQFYAQEWCAVNDGSCTLHEFIGPLFYLGEASIDPIPGINSSKPGNPSNHALASIVWGTEKDIQQATYGCGPEGAKTVCSEKYLKFWVVTWMEDAQGSLVAEYKEHGLTMLPPAKLTSIADFPIEAISNNAGLYQQDMYICPADLPCPPPGEAATGADIQLDAIDTSKVRVKRYEPFDLTATITAGDNGTGPVHLLFYDGDPAQNGELLDIERVPFVKAGSNYASKVEIRPRNIGIRDLFVVSERALSRQISSTRIGVSPQEIGTASCTNPLSPGSKIRGSAIQSGNVAKKIVTRIRGEFQTNAALNLGAASLTVNKLLDEDGGAGELIRGTDGVSVLPMTLTAQPSPRRNQFVFQSAENKFPLVILKLKKLSNRLKMDLQVHSEFPLQPELCQGTPTSTTLDTLFTALSDGITTHGSLAVSGNWRCRKNRNGEIHTLSLKQ